MTSEPVQSQNSTAPKIFVITLGVLWAMHGINFIFQFLTGAILSALPVAIVIYALMIGVFLALGARKPWAHFVVMVLVMLAVAYHVMFLLTADFSRIKTASPAIQIGLGFVVFHILVSFWLFYALNRRDVRLWCNRKV
jgi:hypothetical protein